MSLTPENQAKLKEYAQGIAKILYADADKSRLTTLGEIESCIREQVQAYVTPELGVFLLKQLQEQAADTSAP
jgi:hypothetical protein